MSADHAPDLLLGRPHPARIYDYFLGGKDHYEADEEAAGKIEEVFPAMPIAARVNRAFMRRVVRWLADEVGIRQFLDIGSGIPTEPNLHQIVQAVAPDCRVVYVDNDPVARVHAQALLTSTPQGRAVFIPADATQPQAILSAPELRETLDLSQPVALSLIAMLHLISDDRDAYGLVRQLLSVLPSGSALAISHLTGDFDPEAMRVTAEILRKGGTELRTRSRLEIGQFFTGLELVEPGIDVPQRWRSDNDEEAARIGSAQVKDADSSLWAGVAIKL